MKKMLLISSLILSSFFSNATIHVINVWAGYLQFLPANLTVELGDTIQWLPLDQPSMVHTVTSTNIPVGAATFDQIWQAPADTFFQYIPLIAGLYEYECTPHAGIGIIGSFNVIDNSTAINDITEEQNKALVFPNPATNTFRFLEVEINTSFKIYGSNGALLLSGKTEEEVNISTLKPGMYFIEIIGNQSRRIEKFLKQ